ncbi:TonB-dependent receptor plug domain-containing protein [uncultured Draconibacterium sp.]|uniref:TonB-dependent receptor n=1 Tax=uncultured Draconibacterium sp. TaxID=1573823 RepID=UPI003260FA6D
MKKLVSLVFVLLIGVQLLAQKQGTIEINTRKTPLNQVLLDLKEKYGFEFAYDSDLLSAFPVTAINKHFNSNEEAVQYLIKDLPLKLERSGNVLLIIPKKEPRQVTGVTRISGRVMEANTFEPLPYSYILINRLPVQSDLQGQFNFIASADTTFNLQISHLGYFVYDTVVTGSIHRNFFLYPQIERIQEIKIYSNPIEKSTLIGDMPGQMKINHQIAPVLPGHGDNSVFNLLRLMPGILASGEQSNDLLIWGAYESQSKIQFDGFTVFGLKNFNDNIAVVNPFVVKNIEVLKGGYGARYGERVGGIVDIQGKNGSLLQPAFTFNINSTTVNSMLEVPLSSKSSLLAAYRQTYYQLYNPTNITWFARDNSNGNGQGAAQGNSSSNAIDFEVQPDFVFRDANLKYVYEGEKGKRFAFSLYGGGDDFNYDMESEFGRTIFNRSEKEKNQQLGGSVQIGLPHRNGNTTNLTLSYALFERQIFERNKTENNRTGEIKIRREITSENTVDEVSFGAEHIFNMKDGHRVIAGAGIIDNNVELLRISLNQELLNITNHSPRLWGYVQDEYPLGKHLLFKTGGRVTYVNEVEKWYFEPRLSASIKLSESVKLNASWGKYNQYLSKTTVVDSSNNFTNFWINADNDLVPVLQAEHWVGGMSYNKNGFTVSAEVYNKTTTGLNRFFIGNKRINQGFYTGRAKSRGLDLFVKKEFKRHMAWVSYTLSNTEENYPFYVSDEWRPAPHQQKHELKFAGVFNYRSFYLSANYIYGSGFERFDIDSSLDLDRPYRRLDASLVYKFKPGKVKAEAGISILNILNTDNIKYSNIRVSTVDNVNLVGVYSDAVAFTPAVFFKITF